MIGLFRYREIFDYSISKLIIVYILLISFCTTISLAQQGNTVTVQTQTPDGSKHADYSLVLENEQYSLKDSSKTDITGKVVFTDVTTPVEDKNPMILKGYKLEQNYPNPIDNTLSKIRYQVPTDATNVNVDIRIYNILGEEVRSLVNQEVSPGVYETAWDGKNNFDTPVADGVYIYRMTTKDGSITKKIIMLGSNGPSLKEPGSKFLKNPQDGQLEKPGSVEYVLSGIDSSGRFDPNTQNHTIAGDTLLNMLLTEQLTKTHPSSISWSKGDTIQIPYAWFEFGTALDTLINENPDWKVTRSDELGFYITSTDPNETRDIPIELLAKAIYGTQDFTTIPTFYNPGPGRIAAGEVKTPNGTPLNGINVAAYDTLNNLLKQTMSGADGNYTLDSLYQETIDLIFNDPQNRTDTDTSRVALPSWLEKFLQETYGGYLGGQPQGIEGGEIGFRKADFHYNNGLDTLILQNTGIWHWTRSKPDSIFYAANDPQANGDLLIQLIAQATGGTPNQEDIIANLTDMVNISGKIVDNDLYFQGDGPPHPGVLDYLGERAVFSNGIYTIRVPAQDSIDIETTPINSQGDTIGWTSTHRIPADTDQTGIILHPVTNNMIEGLEALFTEFYEIVNNRPGSHGYSGKKYIDTNGEYWISRKLFNGDTVAVADQDSVAEYLENFLIPGQQQPLSIYKATLEDSIEIGHGGGRIYIFIYPSGNSSVGIQDFNDDGIMDEAYVDLTKSAGRFYWPWAAEEIFTAEAGPNELNDSRFDEYTVLQSSNSIPHIELQVFDKKLRPIGENFPPKEKKSRIFGGTKFNQ